jgi:hypothetical protein
LVSSFDFKFHEFVIWNVMNAIHGARLNGNCKVTPWEAVRWAICAVQLVKQWTSPREDIETYSWLFHRHRPID